MRRMHCLVTVIALCLAALAGCVSGSDSIPPPLAGRWEFVHKMADGDVQPLDEDGQWVRFASVQEIENPLDGWNDSGWGFECYDGCNMNWARLRLTRSGGLQRRGAFGMTAMACSTLVEGAQATVEANPDRFESLRATAEANGFVDLSWGEVSRPMQGELCRELGQVVHFEAHDDQVWLYTTDDRSQAMVLRKASQTGRR